jgi:hypothetical protein
MQGGGERCRERDGRKCARDVDGVICGLAPARAERAAKGACKTLSIQTYLKI